MSALTSRRLIGVAGLTLGLLAAGCLSRRPDPRAEHARFDFSMTDPSGQAVRLADFKGRPLIVNFWATYCGPCRTEIPALNALADEYRSRRLTVLGVSLDDNTADIETFLGTQPIRYPILLGFGHTDFLAAYEANVTIPVSWIIRPDGTVQAKVVGPETRQWFEAQIKAML